MCGILGHIGKKANCNFKVALESIIHRGPDASGLFECTSLSGSFIQFGHRRLSILDTSESSNQPFFSEDQRYVLIFNGEIYNYESIKYELIQLGDIFTTTGDTEVLFKLLVRFGSDAIVRLEGMFSFAFFDALKGEVLLVRDQLGVKPLYYYFNNETLSFSSELKSIFNLYPEARKYDTSLFAEFLLNGFIYEPETGFENIFKVKPGHFAIFNLENSELTHFCYWNGLSKISGKDCLQNDSLNELVTRSIKLQRHCDVPVGLFFSGGIDSSIILTTCENGIPSIFARSSDSQINESGFGSDYKYANKICDYVGQEIHYVNIDDDSIDSCDFLNSIDKVAAGNEELISDYTFLSSYLLSLESRKNGYKVMLSGMGADEIFGGYPRYQILKHRGLLTFLKPLILLTGKRLKFFSKKLDRLMTFLKEKDFVMSYSGLVGVFSNSEVSEILGNEDGGERYKNKIADLLSDVKDYSIIKKALYLDRFGFLSHNFMVADKSSMLASIELRVPLATADLVEYSWKKSDSFFLNLFFRKVALLKLLLKKLPVKFIIRRKVGFNPPLDVKINQIGRDSIKILFAEDIVFRKHVNVNFVFNIIDEHFDCEKNNTYKIYQLLFFRSWLNLNS